MQKLRKNEYEHRSIKYLINQIRRGPKRLLKHVIVQDNNEASEKVINQRDQLEEIIIN